MTIKKFKVIQCKFCGQWQIMGGIFFQCKRCLKRTKLKLDSEYGLHLKILESFDTGLEAQKFLQEYMKQLHKNKFIGFKTYGVSKCQTD